MAFFLHRYQLVGVSMWKNDHYTAKLKINKEWWFYDDMNSSIYLEEFLHNPNDAVLTYCFYGTVNILIYKFFTTLEID